MSETEPISTELSKNEIVIIRESCSGCPTIYDVRLPDGTDGYLRYRFGNISLNTNSETETKPIELEHIGDDDWGGFIELPDAVKWLESKGYTVRDMLY